jgi:nucleotide-binding universal stress UspA family protein
MKSILIPIDFSAASRNTLQYIADFSHDFLVEEILLLKAYHIPLISRLMPSPDMVQLSAEEMAEDRRESEKKFQAIVQEFKVRTKETVKVNAMFVMDAIIPAITRIVKLYEPELIAIGNSLNNDADCTLKEDIVPIAKMSTVPVLLIPTDSRYFKLERVLLPTSFENLERLKSFKKLCKSQAWLKADIIVLNVDGNHRHDEIADDDYDVLGKYLDTFQYHIEYSYGPDVAKDILKAAWDYHVQVILALPGRHSFYHDLLHNSVTKTFALHARIPVLLLK